VVAEFMFGIDVFYAFVYDRFYFWIFFSVERVNQEFSCCRETPFSEEFCEFARAFF
jgi:hypothetical protein